MKTRKILAILFFFLLPGFCLAQFSDDFSDGDFTLNPPWQGDQSKFSITTTRMRLSAPAVAATAYLTTPSAAIHNAIWEVFVQMDFTPSSTNYAKIYLTADQANLAGPINGYFIKVGNTSREVSLYRQSGASETEIIDGLDDRLNVALVKLRIKVTRSAAGEWQLLSDIGLTGTYLSEGNVADQTHTVSSFFGVQCIYTATRSDKFWFDDFVVSGTAVPDTTPPAIRSIAVPNQSQINILFSEPVDQLSVEQQGHFVLNFAGTLSSGLQSDQQTVSLSLSNPLVNGVTYALLISGVRDLAGNTLTATTVNVLFFLPQPAKKKDILLTELLADPTPQLGLPLAEFVEIYNHSGHAFDLQGWNLSDGNSIGFFPRQIILPGEYWIITSSSNSSLFTTFGKTLGLTNFPTLNNSGDVVTLKDAGGKLIDSINYNLEWYRDLDKEEGGWSMELIDPDSPCRGQENWAASEAIQGGTPGMQNSIFANNPDRTEPELISAIVEGSTLLSVRFNEVLDPSSLAIRNFEITPVVNVVRTYFKDISLSVIQLELGDALQLRQFYTLEVKDIPDCSGNRAAISSLSFGVPEKADSLDLLLNEILFNPSAGNVDFVELHNISLKFLQLGNWKLANDDGEGPVGVKAIGGDRIVLAPDGYVVYTSDPVLLKLQYPDSRETNLIKTALPSLPDDEGSIAILNETGKVIDRLSYSSSWHSGFLKSEEGVSLERISSTAPTQDHNNWTSASSRTAFATPGYANSQGRGNEQPKGDVMLIPEIFLPVEGVNSFTEIQYQFDFSGSIANVLILNNRSMVVKTLSNNEIIGSKGFFRWDGDQDDGTRASAGFYIVWFEVFQENGVVQTFRRRVIVASR